jgi:hypothetical protein
MKKSGLITIALVLFSWQLFAQDSKKEKDPDEQIIVNKKYDENGNLIQFDSTYVHKWSSDSTFQFSFPDNDFFAGNGFPGIDEFFKNFMGDSAVAGFNFPEYFGNMPFDTDSSMQYFFNGPGNVPPGFSFPNFEKFEEQLKKYPLPDSLMPQFDNEEQRKEWQELMEKHQKEKKDMMRRWEKEK